MGRLEGLFQERSPVSAPTDPAEVETRTSAPGSLGEWCVRRGFATEEQIQECLALQREEEKAGRRPPRLGEILVRRQLLTPAQVSQALSDQQTEVRYCPRCGVRVNVSLRQDAVWYRCARCQGPLVAPPSSTQIDVVDEAAIVVSRDPLPLEVQIAARLPERHFGKYIVLRELGSGGVGRVDLVWDTYLSQYVALKRLRPRLTVETPEMAEAWTYSLLKEARHSIRLRHPGIVSVFDVGRINKEFYIAMEYLEGETLFARLQASRDSGQLSPYYENPKQILRLLADVARAVHYAHTRPSPVIHCDLKPSNIIIGRDGRPRVFDFGLARNVHPENDEGEISGTPSYMAPEQAAGKTGDIDGRTDVWALGAILYELLTGQPPFTGQLLEVLRRTVSERPRSINDAISDTTRRMGPGEISTRKLVQVPPFLEELCMACLSKEKEKRPASMGEVADAIERGMTPRAEPKKVPVAVAAPAPAPAPAPSAPPPPPAPPRRARLLAAAGLALAASGILVAWNAVKSGAPEVRVARDLAAFHLEDALSSAGEGPLGDEVRTVLRLRARLISRLSAGPVPLGELRLRERTLHSVTLDAVDPRSLCVARDGVRTAVPWSDLEPSQFLALVHDRLPEPDEEDRLALGVYCWSVGRVTEAREHLGSLAGTGTGARADRILRRIENR
jgi:serine/threonine protein kinase